MNPTSVNIYDVSGSRDSKSAVLKYDGLVSDIDSGDIVYGPTQGAFTTFTAGDRFFTDLAVYGGNLYYTENLPTAGTSSSIYTMDLSTKVETDTTYNITHNFTPGEDPGLGFYLDQDTGNMYVIIVSENTPRLRIQKFTGSAVSTLYDTSTSIADNNTNEFFGRPDGQQSMNDTAVISRCRVGDTLYAASYIYGTIGTASTFYVTVDLTDDSVTRTNITSALATGTAIMVGATGIEGKDMLVCYYVGDNHYFVSLVTGTEWEVDASDNDRLDWAGCAALWIGPDEFFVYQSRLVGITSDIIGIHLKPDGSSMSYLVYEDVTTAQPKLVADPSIGGVYIFGNAHKFITLQNKILE